MADFRDKYWYEDIRQITTIQELLLGSRELYGDNPAFWIKKKKGTPFGGEKNQGDVMQLASNYNMIDENGNVQPTFLKFIKDIGYFG